MRRGWLVCLALLAVVEAGDRDVALFLLKKAEKACRARKYEEAADTFKRAREEFTPLPEAAFGMGQAFEKLERNAEAIAAYRLCAEEVAAAEKPSARWKGFARRANAAVTRIRRRFAQLDKLTRAFIDDCMKFGIARVKTDPRWAQTAFETVLRLDPTHSRARRCLDKFKKVEAWGTPLIRGDDLEGWSPGIRPPWTCAKGVVAADVGNPGHINWVNDVELTGRYEVRVRMRVVRSAAQWTFGLLIGNGTDYWHNFFVKDGHSIRFDEFDGGNMRPCKDAILRDFDAQKWNTLRLAVDRGSLSVFMNEKKLFEYDADERDTFDGNVALFGQSGMFEFREFEVRR